MEWFPSAHTAKEIDAATDVAMHTDQGDAATDVSEGGGDELLYFTRYEVMYRLIAARYPDLEESFCDHVIETLYAALF